MSILKQRDDELNPCQNLCQPNLRVCTGCGRNEHQRTYWASYSDDFKRATMRKIRNENKGNL